ncbi:MAG: hypothetical protein IT435_02525 [Phycisphaerales bacterium]|nr:hypothetical protein [Phycisphaerales bacterium]
MEKNVTAAQRESWELLLRLDSEGQGLTQEEIAFVAGLIDNDREGRLHVSEMNRISALFKLRVEDCEEEEID